MVCGLELVGAAAGATWGLDSESRREPLRTLEQGRYLVRLGFQKGLCGPKGQNKVPQWRELQRLDLVSLQDRVWKVAVVVLVDLLLGKMCLVFAEARRRWRPVDWLWE